MSDRVIAAELLALVALVNAPGGNKPSVEITVDEIKHFVEGRTGVGSITFEIDEDHCAVVVAIEETNVDYASARTASQSAKNSVVTEVQASAVVTGSDLFYVFAPGTVKLNLAATPQGGKIYFARAVGYRLPKAALKRLRSVGTQLPS